MESLVYILLASYNGEKYIETQLKSLLSQTHTNWCLLIRDDGSTDCTLEIIEKYIKKDARIKIIDEIDLNRGKGACQNFHSLIKVAVAQEASFILFCDQDDYWFPNKIEQLLNNIVRTNSAMVYSDFLYADEKLNELPAPIQKKKSSFRFPLFKNLIVQNNVYGCTMMITGELAKKCLPIPSVAENHDYWILLVTSGINAKIYHLKESLMLYRQHENNVTGSFKDHHNLARYKRVIFKFEDLTKKEFEKILMLDRFYKELKEVLAFENKDLLEGYLKALKKSKMSIIFYCFKHKIKRQSFLSTFIYFCILFNLNKQKLFSK